MSRIRIFISTFMTVGCIAAIGMLLLPFLLGHLPFTGAGFAAAFQEIHWPLAAIIASFFAVLRVLWESEFFRELVDFAFRWIR